jgi:signal transduction histidine kinase
LPARQLNLDGLRDLLSVVNSSRGIDEILAYLVRKAHDVLESDGAAVYLIDADDPTMLRAHASYGIATSLLADTTPVGYPVTGLAVSLRRPVVVANMAAALARGHAANVEEQFKDRGEFVEVTRPGPVSVDDVEQRHRNDDIATAFATLIAVPLMAHGEIFGALELFYRDQLAFGPEHIDISLAFAQQGALALENARLRTQAEQRLVEIGRRQRVAEAMRDLLAVVNSSGSVDEILSRVLEQTSDLLGSDAGSVLLVDDTSGVMTVRASRALASDLLPLRLPVGTAITGVAVERRRPAAVFDLSAAAPIPGHSEPEIHDRGGFLELRRVGDPGQVVVEADGFPRVAHIARHYKALLAVPLIVRGEVIGAITLYYRTPREFSPEDVTLAEAFVDQTALAMENARLFEQAQHVATLEERERLARELHDAVTQTLFSASLIAEVVPRLWELDPDEGRQRVDDLRRLTRGALSEMRTLLLELRPAALVETPLQQLLSQLAETTMSRSNVEAEVHAHGRPATLAPDVHVALYRIVQEALNNIVKHAAASHVSIHLCWRPRGVDLRVKDDGRGFVRSDISRGRLGLGIMEERAQAIGASLRVRSKHALGTTVDLHWRAQS